VRARLLAALAALSSPWASQADDPAARGFDADPYRFAATLDGDFMVETAAVQLAGSWRGELILQDAVGLIPWKSGNETVGYVIPNRFSATLQGAYSLGWLELAVDLPIVLYQSSDLDPLTSLGIGPPLAAPIGATELGDARVVGKLAIVSARHFPIGLSALLDLRIPTGSKESFTGDGFMAIPGGVVSAQFGRTRLDLQLGYVFRNPGQFLQLVVQDAFTYGLGAAVELPPVWEFRSWRAIADLSGQIPRGFTTSSDRYSAPLDGRIGVRAFFREHLGAELGIGTGLGTAAFGRETFRAFAGLRWDVTRADRDGDGVPDDEDRCPDQPGPKEQQGCPGEGDRDGDGVPDSQDRCPDVKGPKELEGCPDTDGDGIPDIDDKCPTVPGPAQNDGCPGEAVVEIETERLSLKDAINFDTGQDTIRPESKRILDEIAAVLKAHPEIKRIRVEGHTDNVGGQAYNMDLSERRARAVVTALLSRGIARDRLTSAGYGFGRPVATNATALGRAKNRRVEFTILLEKEGEGGEKEPARK
jgi:outer membrane protein OmpA-like peptidoglycan-associated protein